MKKLLKLMVIGAILLLCQPKQNTHLIVRAMEEPFLISYNIEELKDDLIIDSGWAFPSNLLPTISKVETEIAGSGDAQPEIPELLKRIIQCESGWNPLAKNPNSTASGMAQFIDSTWKETMRKMGLPENSNVFDGELNLKAAQFLFAEQGVKPWLASRGCWE